MELPNLSEETRRLLERLVAVRGIWFPFFLVGGAAQREREEILGEIAARGELRSVVYLRKFIYPGAELSRAAAGAVNTLLAGVAPEVLPVLLEELGSRSWWDDMWDPDAVWFGLGTDDLKRLDFGPVEFPNAWGVLTRHPDGYVREAALRRLGECRSGEEIPYLLMRLVDWVPEVRAVASALLRERLEAKYAGALSHNLLLVTRLIRSGRFEDTALLEKILEVLRLDDDFLARIDGGSTQMSRVAMDVALKKDDVVGRAAIGIGRAHGDVVLRVKALRKAGEYFADGEIEAFLEEALGDSSGWMRKTALEITVQRFPERVRERMMVALFDSGGMNRALARYHLEGMTRGDFRALYREALGADDVRLVRGGLWGLGDVGMPVDADAVLALVGDANPQTRRIALKTLGSIALAEHGNVFFEALSDEVVGVSRVAADGLLKLEVPEIADELFELALRTEQAHVRNHALMLLEGMSMRLWARVVYFMRFVLGGKVASDEVSLERFRRVLARTRASDVYVKPTDAEREELRGLVAGDWRGVLSDEEVWGLERFLG